jgi:serine/threonine-protein kinase RsbW/stage II sporulation protein AB (anti-sigma F factor)
MLLTPQRTLEQVYPAHPASVGRARLDAAAFAAHEGASPEEVERVRLSVSEAATNAVRHAYPDGPGRFQLTATAVDGELWVLVADEGCGHQSPPVDPGLGWGLALIAQASDDFILAERSPRGTEAQMRFRLRGPERC